jgi:hypothetical protein
MIDCSHRLHVDPITFCGWYKVGPKNYVRTELNAVVEPVGESGSYME